MHCVPNRDQILALAPGAAEQAEAIQAIKPEKPTLRCRVAALSCKAAGYAGLGMAAVGLPVRSAFAQSLNITDINSIFTFVGMAITVVGAALAGWNLVQVGMSMKDSQGFQMDKNVWGVVGGVAMIVAGQVFNQAASMWRS